MWLDNFNRNFAAGNVSIKDGVYHAGNWTATGIHRCAQIIDRSWKDPSGKVRGHFGLPDDLFTKTSHRAWLMRQMRVCDDKGLKYQKKSLINKFDVRRVPLKPSRRKVTNARHKEGLKHNGLDRFYPYDLMQPNIGSNDGLLDVMHTFWQTHWKKHPDFQMVVADSNIFMRILKVSAC
jgi:hypothetical protein